jgi:hypothetical protein
MKRLWLFLALLMISSSAFAQTKKPLLTGDPIKDLQSIKADVQGDFTKATGVKATGDLGYDILKMLDAKVLPDLQYAKKLADANGNSLTSACWAAWITIIETNQGAVTDPTTKAVIDPPDPHILVDLQRAIDIRNALQPSSPFMVACSPVANLIKTDVQNFIGQVLGGGLSVAKLLTLGG